MKKILIALITLSSLTAFAGDPEKAASELGAQGYSCQIEKFVIDQLLSDSPLNLETIEAARKIYVKCINEVFVVIFKTSGSADTVFEKLQSKKLVCENQISRLEDLLSEDELNYEEIDKAKQAFLKCRAGAKKVIATK